MSRTVFISREVSDCAELIPLLEKQGLRVLASSMIKTEPVSFEKNIPQTDWIFFSSKNGVRYFFEQKPEISGQRFAAVGEGTAGVLSEYAKTDFIGKHIDTEITAQDFLKRVGEETVLFPRSEQSLKTIQNIFPAKQVYELICYRTIPDGKEIGFADILVFSSPSNVDAFFKKNRWLHYQKVIAFGYSTEKALKKYGAEQVWIPESLDNETLADTIIQVSGS